MKSKKWSIIFILSVLQILCYGQKTSEPAFEYIEWADYILNSKGQVEVSFYVFIDLSQNILILDCRSESPTSYSYKLTENTIAKLNMVFNGRKPLEKHLTLKSLEKDQFYAGSYKFITYVTKNGIKDSLTTITPFSSTALEHVISEVIRSFNTNQNFKKDPIVISNSFLSSLQDSYQKATYLPNRILPPVQKNI